VGIDLALGTAEETTVMPRDARAVLHRLRRERGRGSVAAIDQLAGLAEASRALAVHLAGEKEGLRADRLAALEAHLAALERDMRLAREALDERGAGRAIELLSRAVDELGAAERTLAARG